MLKRICYSLLLCVAACSSTSTSADPSSASANETAQANPDPPSSSASAPGDNAMGSQCDLFSFDSHCEGTGLVVCDNGFLETLPDHPRCVCELYCGTDENSFPAVYNCNGVEVEVCDYYDEATNSGLPTGCQDDAQAGGAAYCLPPPSAG